MLFHVPQSRLGDLGLLYFIDRIAWPIRIFQQHVPHSQQIDPSDPFPIAAQRLPARRCGYGRANQALTRRRYNGRKIYPYNDRYTTDYRLRILGYTLRTSSERRRSRRSPQAASMGWTSNVTYWNPWRSGPMRCFEPLRWQSALRWRSPLKSFLFSTRFHCKWNTSCHARFQRRLLRSP